jgi:hypothetical protein
MARIRTIKPSFFTSADMIDLSCAARLFYIGLWCEADREGRLKWNPRSLKLRYFPEQPVDIDALAAELISGGHIVIYGDHSEFCHIPTFRTHQQVNVKEAVSTIPSPGSYASAPVNSGNDASVPSGADTGIPVNSHAGTETHGNARGERKGRGRKGKEGDTPLPPSGENLGSSRLSPTDRAKGVYKLLELSLRVKPVYDSLVTYFEHGKSAIKTEMAYTKLANRLNEFTPAEIVEAVDVAISSGHQGLFPKKSDGKRVPAPTKANTPVEVDVEDLEWMTS